MPGFVFTRWDKTFLLNKDAIIMLTMEVQNLKQYGVQAKEGEL